MKNKKASIIVDSNYLGYCAKYAITPKLKTTTGIPTNIIFGFLQSIITLVSVYNPRQIIFVWDSRKSNRKKLFADYKKSRHKNLTEQEKIELKQAYRQFQVLRKRILPKLGFKNNFLVPGYEGDDLIASILRNDTEYQEFLICANDHDLYQLLSPRISIIGKKEIYTIDKFVKQFGINPSQWVDVKALAGCSSDEVPGIKGIGEKTACKYLRQELKATSVAFCSIAKEKKEVEARNLPLVRLPFFGTPEIKLQPDVLNIAEAKKIFQYFELDTFIDEFDEWEEFLK